jgi:hypothetical protein
LDEQSDTKYKYVLGFTDDYSHYTKVYLLRHKYDFLRHFEFTSKVKYIYIILGSDNGKDINLLILLYFVNTMVLKIN